MAVHHVDLWRFLLRSEAEEVFASSRSEEGDDVKATVTAKLTGSALAVSGFSQRAAEAHEIEVCGRDGRLLASLYRFDGFELHPATGFPGDLKSRARRLLRTMRALPASVPAALRGGDFLDSYRAEWQHFAESALGATPVESTLDDGRRALEIVLATIQSARTGHPVPVGRAPRHIEEAESLDA